MLLAFFANHRERIVDMLSQRIRHSTSVSTPFDPHTLRDHVAQVADAFLLALREEDPAVLDRCLADIVAPRAVDEFPLAALHHAFTVFGELLLPLLQECHGDDTARIPADLQRVHRLIYTTLNKVVAHYEARSKALVRHQHEQLQAHSQQLETQLIRVGEDFQTLQEFNERILQSMTSGLLVADKTTHRILKVNHAMARLSGMAAEDMVGKIVEDVFASVQGLPIAAFAEEIERQGTITRGKYRLDDDTGCERYRAIQGQVLANAQGEAAGVMVLVDDISEAEILRNTFSRYLSREVMEQVLSSADLRSLRSTRCEVTVLFADIRSFTSFAEQHQPEHVVEVLNQYLDKMVQVLFDHQGTLDKFLGDGLLALFGKPLQQPDHPRRAVQAALDIQHALAELNTARRRSGEPVLGLGIGINSGEAIVGNIGSEKRMEYTVIGDMVNVAQRLQGQARGGEIMISDHVLPHVQPYVRVEETIEVQVKGRQQLVRAHRIGPR